MRNLFLSLAGVALFIIVVGLLTKTNRGETTILSRFFPNLPSASSPQTDLKTIKVGTKTIHVTVADTDEKKSKGLGEVTSLPADQGMLFVFPGGNYTPTFWMKGMKISIDIMWIKDNKIMKIDANAAPPMGNVADYQLTKYTSGAPVDYVLEVNANFASQNNIKVGDIVDANQI